MKAPLIMVVDDDRLVRLIAVSWLVEAGFHVIAARTGLDCLEQYESVGPANISLVILELHTPVEEGTETFQQLRELNPSARILIHSASLRMAEVDLLRSAGACGIIPKPCARSEFLYQVRAVVGASHYAEDEGAALTFHCRSDHAGFADWRTA